MSQSYNYVEEIENLRSRVAELESFILTDDDLVKPPKPNTKDEWKTFAYHWADGGWNTIQWYDVSEGERTWYDMEEDDAFYPFHEQIIMRFKT